MSVHVMARVWKLDLPATDKFVLLAIADNANEDGLAWPGRVRLAAKCGMNPRTITAAIGRLEALGVLIVDRSKNGRGHVNRYRVVPSERVKEIPPFGWREPGKGEGDSTGRVNEVPPPLEADSTQEPPVEPSSEPPPTPPDDEPGPEDIRSLTGRGVYAHPLQQHARRKVATSLLNAYCAGLGHKPRGARSTKPFVDALMRLLEQQFPLDVLRAALDECGESPWELEAAAHAVRGRQQRQRQVPDTSWYPDQQPQVDPDHLEVPADMREKIAGLLAKGRPGRDGEGA